MKEFLKKKGIALGVIVLAAVLVVVFSARALDGKAGFFANAAGAVKAPVLKAATAVSDWLEGVYGYLYEYDRLLADNDSLRRRLAEAEARAQAGEDAVEENTRLRELLSYTEKHTDLVTESAKIVAWNPSNWTSSFTISKGSDQGLALGDAVITEYGALVGEISELGSSWAEVCTVIDVETSLGALVGDDGAAAMVIGSYALMQKGAVKLAYLSEGAQMLMDDQILTSGSGGLFPQGLTIGTVSSIQTEAGGQTEYGIIKPACDLSALVQVFVIKDFKVTE
ncbi:MAG: rod shape-determining protein MreC [Oscillospiraceae bacterium]